MSLSEAGNLYGFFRERFASRIDRPCIIDADGAVTTYGDIDVLSARFAAVLRECGASTGARVLAQVEKSVAAVALYLACLRTGAVYAPLNTAYTAAETDYFIHDLEPELVVLAAPRETAARRTLHLGASNETGLYGRALDASPDQRLEPRTNDDVAAILYTSGTTGRSKGAMLTIGNLAFGARALHRIWSLRDDDVLLHALPIFHGHGLFVALHCALFAAMPMLFLPKFDAQEVRARLPGATVMMGVPTFYTRLLALAGFGPEDCRSVRLFISGSAPMLPGTQSAFERRTGRRILERYGMTEAGIITSNSLSAEYSPGAVGFPLPGVALRIIGEGGRPIGSGTPGVIEIKGPNVFAGYWRSPDKTSEAFREDGYFITGDIGVKDEDGRISIVGRARDLIISGGYNIYPSEIEVLLNSLPGVIESAVVGAPHPDLGEGVIAIVVVAPQDAPSPQDIRSALNGRLARFKQPKHIAIVDALPRNALGKVTKESLRRAYRHVFS